MAEEAHPLRRAPHATAASRWCARARCVEAKRGGGGDENLGQSEVVI